jgi:hypothetical protein
MKAFQVRSNPRVGVVILGLFAATVSTVLQAQACDTPVYRFAMYSKRWAPWPYYVFYVHPGKEADLDAAVNAKLKSLVAENRELTNLEFQAVDATETDALAKLPRCIRRAWESRGDKSAPLHIVVSPAAANPKIGEVFAGRIETGDIDALIDSPARKEMAKLLSEGRLVLLFLEGKKADLNAAAEKTVTEILEKINAGKIEELRPALEPAEGLAKDLVPPAAKDKKQPDPAESRKLKTSILKVSRTDPRETWLVRMLQRVDTELDDLVDQPMAFWIYGRGRAMPPLVGEGITPENLVGDVRLLIGPCTCEVKDENPGADLLTTNDWEAAARKMAGLFAEEEGNQELDVTSLVPRLDITPRDVPASELAISGLGPLLESTANAASGSGSQSGDSSDPAPAPAASSGSRRVLRYVGIAFGCALLLILAVSLPFLRRGNRRG